MDITKKVKDLSLKYLALDCTCKEGEVEVCTKCKIGTALLVVDKLLDLAIEDASLEV